MPYKIVKVKGGYKVRNVDTGSFYSSYALTKEMANRQLLAIMISEGLIRKN
jgi:hypothetical protein